MALWGSVRHSASSPLSHTISQSRHAMNQERLSLSTNSIVAEEKSTISRRSSLDASRGCEFREGQDPAKSFTRYDDENLSSSMKRSLQLLNMMPYRGGCAPSALCNLQPLHFWLSLY